MSDQSRSSEERGALVGSAIHSNFRVRSACLSRSPVAPPSPAFYRLWVPPRTYSSEEVQAILARALEDASGRGDDLSHDDLLAIGRELGVSAQAIEAAADNVGDQVAVDKLVQNRVRASRRGLVNHLMAFVLVNALLAVINVTLGGPMWFLWSVFGWGIGLAFHMRAVLLPDRERMAEQARRKLERDAKRARREQIREDVRRGVGQGGKVIEAAVQDVVAETLGVVADAIAGSRRHRSGRDVRADSNGRGGVRERERERDRARVDPRPGVRVDPSASQNGREDDELHDEDEQARDRKRSR